MLRVPKKTTALKPSVATGARRSGRLVAKAQQAEADRKLRQAKRRLCREKFIRPEADRMDGECTSSDAGGESSNDEDSSDGGKAPKRKRRRK